jgi:hypothetical protein
VQQGPALIGWVIAEPNPSRLGANQWHRAVSDVGGSMAAPELFEEDTFYECLAEERALDSWEAAEDASVLNRLHAAREAYEGRPDLESSEVHGVLVNTMLCRWSEMLRGFAPPPTPGGKTSHAKEVKKIPGGSDKQRLVSTA